jgi:hypothetical protein
MSPPWGRASCSCRAPLTRGQAAEGHLDPIFERCVRRQAARRGTGRVARLGRGVAKRLQRRDDLALACPESTARLPRAGRGGSSHARLRHLLLELEDHSPGELLADPAHRREDHLVGLQDRELQVRHSARGDDRERHFRTDPRDAKELLEEAELVGAPEAVQRLCLFPHEMVRAQADVRPGGHAGEHGR